MGDNSEQRDIEIAECLRLWSEGRYGRTEAEAELRRLGYKARDIADMLDRRQVARTRHEHPYAWFSEAPGMVRWSECPKVDAWDISRYMKQDAIIEQALDRLSRAPGVVQVMDLSIHNDPVVKAWREKVDAAIAKAMNGRSLCWGNYKFSYPLAVPQKFDGMYQEDYDWQKAAKFD